MDTLTHALLGGTIGATVLGRRLGWRAAVWGGVAAAVPDLDILPVLLSDPISEWRLHRGATHSFIVATLAAPLFGWIAARRAPETGRRRAWRDWGLLWLLGLCSHIILDVMTSYGTQILWPLSPFRAAWHVIPVIDPLYSVLVLLPFLAGMLLARHWRLVRGLGIAFLALSTLYLFVAGAMNNTARVIAARMLDERGVRVARLMAYPVLFTPYFQRIYAEEAGTGRRWVGAVDLGDVKQSRLDVVEPAAGAGVPALLQTAEGRLLAWFSDGAFAVRRVQEGGKAYLEMNDLRYGSPEAPGLGIWGLRVAVDGEGRLSGPVRHFSRRAALYSQGLRRLAMRSFEFVRRMF